MQVVIVLENGSLTMLGEPVMPKASDDDIW